MQTIEFLIKVNDFGNANMDDLKGFIYKCHYLYHMHQLNDVRLDGECATLDIDSIRDFSFKNDSDLTVICYDVYRNNMVKTEIKYGFIASRKSMTFNEDMENFLREECKANNSEDVLFNTCYNLLDGMYELTSMPQLNSKVKLNLLCDDEDVLSWYHNLDDNSFKISEIDYKSAMVYTDDCPYGININHVTVLNV